MTIFKVYRVVFDGEVRVELVEASNWADLFNRVLPYSKNPVFKVEVHSARSEPE